MRWPRFAVCILIVTILQADLIDVAAVTSLNIKPDLLLILLVFFAVYCDTTEAIITSFVIGFAADIIGSSMGPGMLSFGILGTLLAYLNRLISIRKMYYQALAIFATGVASGFTVYFLTFLQGQAAGTGRYSFFFWTSVYSAVVGPFFFLPSAWLMRIKKHKA